jgi:hypothetical protein
MSKIEALLAAYDNVISVPWEESLAGPQRVWFAIYDPEQERRLRLRIDEYQQVTRRAGHRWHLVDITHSFGRWMAHEEYRDAYFEDPELLADRMPEFTRFVAGEIVSALTAPTVDERSVVAVLGVGTLFGLTRVAALVEMVAPHIQGRMLVFFPGSYSGANYRLLDARDGWNYLAVPITAAGGG